MGHCLEPEITAGREVHLPSGSSVPPFPHFISWKENSFRPNQTLLFLPGCFTLIVPFWPEASTKELRMFLSPQKPCSESCSSFSAAQLSFLLPWLILQVNKSHLPSKHILLRGPPHPGALSPESHPSCFFRWLHWYLAPFVQAPGKFHSLEPVLSTDLRPHPSHWLTDASA